MNACIKNKVKCMNEYLLLLIGGVIGFLSAFLSAFLTDFFRARREERKWKLESTVEYFRGLYNPLAPFFSAQSKILFALVGVTITEILELPLKKQKQIAYNLESVLKELMEAHKRFIDGGYIGLFPHDVALMIMTYRSKLDRLNKLIKEKGIADKEANKTISDVFSVANQLRDRLRQLLNVDVLD